MKAPYTNRTIAQLIWYGLVMEISHYETANPRKWKLVEV